ncbi:MAG: hypothetical protein ABI947_23030 [Chloroflexota bacterium]
MLSRRFRALMPMLMGAAFLSVPIDVLILFYRLLGLSRPTAVYAGLLTFVVLSGTLAPRYFSPRHAKRSEGDKHV